MVAKKVSIFVLVWILVLPGFGSPLISFLYFVFLLKFYYKQWVFNIGKLLDVFYCISGKLCNSSCPFIRPIYCTFVTIRIASTKIRIRSKQEVLCGMNPSIIPLFQASGFIWNITIWEKIRRKVSKKNEFQILIVNISYS